MQTPIQKAISDLEKLMKAAGTYDPDISGLKLSIQYLQSLLPYERQHLRASIDLESEKRAVAFTEWIAKSNPYFSGGILYIKKDEQNLTFITNNNDFISDLYQYFIENIYNK